MQLWLTPRPQPNTRIHPPTVCPQPGCGGRRFHLHQVVGKGLRDTPPSSTAAARPPARPATAPGTHPGTLSAAQPVKPPATRATTPRRVAVHRYTCCRCRRTFRAYPAGVDRGSVAVGIQRLAAALHLLGLSFRDVSRALGLLGVALGKSQAQALVAPRLRGLERRGVPALLKRVEVTGEGSGRPAAWIWIDGRKLTLRRAVDHRGRAALVVDDIDRETYQAVERWVRGTLSGFGVDVDVVFPVLGARRRRAMLGGLDAGQGEACGERDTDGSGGAGPGDAAELKDADIADGGDGGDGGVGPPAAGLAVADGVGPPAAEIAVADGGRVRRAGGLIGVYD